MQIGVLHKIKNTMVNGVDPDETARYEPSHLDLHCLLCYGWSGGANVSCILRYRDVQLILAYSWARPAVFVAGKGTCRGGCFYFFCFFNFIHVPLSSLFLSFISSTISSISFLPSSGRRHKWPTRVDVSLNPNTIKTKIYTVYTGTCFGLQGWRVKHILFQYFDIYI